MPVSTRNRKRKQKKEINALLLITLRTLTLGLIAMNIIHDIMGFNSFQWPDTPKPVDPIPTNTSMPHVNVTKGITALEKSAVMQTIYQISGNIGLPMLLLREWFAYFLIEYQKK